MTDLIYAIEGFTTRPPSAPLALPGGRGETNNENATVCTGAIVCLGCGHSAIVDCHYCGACLEWQLTGVVVCLFI